MKKSPKKLVLVVVALSATFLFGACSNPVEKVIEKETGAKIDTDKDGNVTVKADDGEVTVGAGTKLPKDLPKSTPLPKGGKLIGVTSTPEHWNLQYHGISESSFEALFAELESAVGPASYENNADRMRMFTFDKGGRVYSGIWTDPDSDQVFIYTIGKTEG